MEYFRDLKILEDEVDEIKKELVEFKNSQK
jgi:hypothetical protein